MTYMIVMLVLSLLLCGLVALASANRRRYRARMRDERRAERAAQWVAMLKMQIDPY